MVELPRDGIASHRNDYRNAKPLSALAIDNLRNWYQRDYEFLETLGDRIGKQLL